MDSQQFLDHIDAGLTAWREDNTRWTLAEPESRPAVVGEVSRRAEAAPHAEDVYDRLQRDPLLRERRGG